MFLPSTHVIVAAAANAGVTATPGELVRRPTRPTQLTRLMRPTQLTRLTRPTQLTHSRASRGSRVCGCAGVRVCG